MKFKFFLTLALAMFTAAEVSAQKISVQGVITSSTDKQPLVGIGVVSMEDRNVGTITDIDGKFSLNVSKGSKLEFSCLGFKTLILEASEIMNVEMTEDTEILEDVVVTGYTSEKKADLTGSVSVVKMKDVADVPTGNVVQALQGRVAGMTVSTDGAPGGQNTGITVRGASSFRSGANGPLYVIDGIMTRDGVGSILNSSDIESIQVLKDAASASIYGAQAANGVIIVTTKRAKDGRMNIDFDATLTMQKYNKGIDLLNADQWGEVYWAAYKNANNGATPNSEIYGNGATPALKAYKNLNGKDVQPKSTDWEDEIHRVSLMQKYGLTISKGTSNGNSALSVSWIDDKGTIKNTSYQKANARLSNDYSFLEGKLRVGANVAVNWWKESLAPDGIEEYAVKQHPAKSVYDESGEYNDAITDVLGDTPNLVRLLDNNNYSRHDNWRVFGNAFININPVKGLSLKSNFGLNYFSTTNKTFEPKWLRDPVNKLNQWSNKSEQWVWSNTAQYDLNLGKNSLMFLAGEEVKREHGEGLSGGGTNVAIEDPNYIYLSTTTAGQVVGSEASNYSMISLFGKVNYSYDSKYLLSATIRRDASSRLSSKKRSDLFYSFSGGWRISQENFMSGAKSWLSDLKIRASYGVNGNDLIDNEAFFTKYKVSLNGSSYNITGDGKTLAPGAFKDRSTNPDLKWEKTYQTNAGLDASFFAGRLNASVDYFYKKTVDMLVEKPYIAAIGEGGYCWYNGGTMVNKGFEGVLSWRDTKGDFNYEIGLNLSIVKNEVTYLLPDIFYTYGGGNGVDKSLVGHSYVEWMGWKTDGVFRTDEEVNEYLAKYDVRFGKPAVGRLRYRDTNNDGIIDQKDRDWLGNDLPKAQFGLNMAFGWKGLDLSLFFNGMVRDAYVNSKLYTDFFQCWTGNHGTVLLDAARAYDDYKKTGVYNCSTPAPTVENSNNENEVSDYYIDNGSFLKLKTLTLGYTLPEKACGTIGLRTARIYFQAQNLFTITGYSGADPECLGFPYALPRQFSLGIQFGF